MKEFEWVGTKGWSKKLRSGEHDSGKGVPHTSLPELGCRVAETHKSAVSDTRTLQNGVDEKVVVVTSDVPHGETEQIVSSDELPFGCV